MEGQVDGQHLPACLPPRSLRSGRGSDLMLALKFSAGAHLRSSVVTCLPTTQPDALLSSLLEVTSTLAPQKTCPSLLLCTSHGRSPCLCRRKAMNPLSNIAPGTLPAAMRATIVTVHELTESQTQTPSYKHH